MALVINASVALKWVLQEPDTPLAEALLQMAPDLLVPDFWLGDATNVLWVQVRRHRFTPVEATEALALLHAIIKPIPTWDLGLHQAALEIGVAVNHSTYDTLYLTFAVAMGARGVVVADAAFVRDVRIRRWPPCR